MIFGGIGAAVLGLLYDPRAATYTVPVREGGTRLGDRDDYHSLVAYGQTLFARARGRISSRVRTKDPEYPFQQPKLPAPMAKPGQVGPFP